MSRVWPPQSRKQRRKQMAFEYINQNCQDCRISLWNLPLGHMSIKLNVLKPHDLMRNDEKSFHFHLGRKGWQPISKDHLNCCQDQTYIRERIIFVILCRPPAVIGRLHVKNNSISLLSFSGCISFSEIASARVRNLSFIGCIGGLCG